MKIVNFTQEGSDWLAWRKGGIGSSDAATVVNHNPYQTRLQLWEIKCGFREEPEMNAFMIHGKECEPKARDWLNSMEHLKLVPICVEDSENPHFRASLDGWDERTKTLVEIKSPKNTTILDAARQSQSLPEYYYAQIQWQIMIAKPHRAILALWDYRAENCIQVEVYPLDSFQKEMRAKANEFWHCVRTGQEPAACDRDYRELVDPLVRTKLEEYEEHHRIQRDAEDHKRRLREEIIEMAKGVNFRCEGFMVTKQSPRKYYDVAQMALDGIDIEKYQKPTNQDYLWRIRCPQKTKKNP